MVTRFRNTVSGIAILDADHAGHLVDDRNDARVVA